tara:strand:- start:4075 stop:4605 length:531 start_codon:yes stop_codon:yes gene_type:complete
MSTLTTNQTEIINQLKKEFLAINDTEKFSSNGLINVAELKKEINAKNQFLAECEAEKNAYSRKVSKQVKVDAEKLRADLNELGLDVKYKDDGYCCHSFSIIQKGGIVELMYISYNDNTYIERYHEKLTKRIYVGFRLRFSYGDSSFSEIHADSIELLVQQDKFKEQLKAHYEDINK